MSNFLYKILNSMAKNFPSFCSYNPYFIFYPSATQVVGSSLDLIYYFPDSWFAWAFCFASIGLSLFSWLILNPLRISSGITTSESLPWCFSDSFCSLSHWVSYPPFCWIKYCTYGYYCTHDIELWLSVPVFTPPQYVSILSQYIICISSIEQSSWHTGGAK